MAEKTILKVRDATRSWDGGQGTVEFITIIFDDDSEGSVGSKPENVQKHKDALNALVGKPTDFGLEAKADFQGTKQWKITAYPGKPGGQGGGGGYSGPFTRDREAAVIAASNFVSRVGDQSLDELFVKAEEILVWIKKAPAAGGSVPGEAPVSSAAGPKANLQQIRQLRTLADTLAWTEPEACAKAGVSVLGELSSADADQLIADWGWLIENAGQAAE